jgi:hypothetical protein
VIEKPTDAYDEPPTEADLSRIEQCLPPRDAPDPLGRFAVTLGAMGDPPEAEFDTDDVYSLLDEVRRLRAELASRPQAFAIGVSATAEPVRGRLLHALFPAPEKRAEDQLVCLRCRKHMRAGDVPDPWQETCPGTPEDPEARP